MSSPFIFIATNRLKPGRLDRERQRVPGLVEFIEASEPRLIGFNEFVNEAGVDGHADYLADVLPILARGVFTSAALVKLTPAAWK